jgi:hypothetical protein
MSRLLVLVAMTLSALASELGSQVHRCVWNGMPRQVRMVRTEKKEGE